MVKRVALLRCLSECMHFCMESGGGSKLSVVGTSMHEIRSRDRYFGRKCAESVQQIMSMGGQLKFN